MLPVSFRISWCLALAASLGAGAAGCARPLVGPNPPTDQAVFPVGLAVHPDGQYLAVTSSNFDLRYNRGAFLLADLDVVADALDATNSPNDANATVTNAYVAGALIPSFGNKPVFVEDGSRALIATRDGNRVVEIPLDVGGGLPRIECAATEVDGTPACGDAPFVIDMPTNDPFEIVLTSQSNSIWRGMVSSLGASEVFAFRVRDDVGNARRGQLLATDSIDFGEEVLSVRGLAVRTEGTPVMIASRELAQEGTTQLRSELAWWVQEDGRDATVRTEALSDEVGPLSVRAITLTPAQDALLVIMRNPPALARYAITGTGAGTRLNHAGSVGTCDDPIRVHVATFDDGEGVSHTRAFLTCFGDDSVVAYDPVTLAELDSLRFFGRGPYDIVTHEQRAFVSYFLDDTIGVVDLVDADGRPKMVGRGRIGIPKPPPEDGRP